MTPWLEDTDLRLYVGDALETLRALPDDSVDCCVTSPPYWGLRDYSVEGQIGLEATPDLFVQKMVEVFREVRRVLAAHGTCWVNLGDSYAASSATGHGGWDGKNKNPDGSPRQNRQAGDKWSRAPTAVGGLKPKDLVGIPWRVAFALQADGWWLRSDIIWAKPNPMPESVTDRPTKAHEYLFLLTKQPRYWFDAEAVREPHKEPWRGNGEAERNNWSAGGTEDSRGSKDTVRLYNPAGRNVRSVWEIATQPYPEAHFATFPEELPRRAIAAGCPLQVCRVCGAPRERIVEREQPPEPEHRQPSKRLEPGQAGNVGNGNMGFRASRLSGQEMNRWRAENPGTERWSDCGHHDYRPGVVLDPFAGSGTTLLVARKLGRHSVGIELNPEYAELIAKRTRQLSLLSEENAA